MIRPDPYVEQEGEVVEPIDGEPLFATQRPFTSRGSALTLTSEATRPPARPLRPREARVKGQSGISCTRLSPTEDGCDSTDVNKNGGDVGLAAPCATGRKDSRGAQGRRGFADSSRNGSK
jgi:hypothetical protein